MVIDLGDVLAVPINRTQYQALKVARLRIATLKNVGNVKIQWTGIFASHLELGRIQGIAKHTEDVPFFLRSWCFKVV
jgi:hypothetical protein